MVFLGSAGHHNSTETTGHATAPSNVSGAWLVDHRATLFAKTALFINAEHTSTLSTFVQAGPNRTRRINCTGMQWYAGGTGRPELQDIAAQAFRDFGVPTYAEPESAAPNGEADVYGRTYLSCSCPITTCSFTRRRTRRTTSRGPVSKRRHGRTRRSSMRE